MIYAHIHLFIHLFTHSFPSSTLLSADLGERDRALALESDLPTDPRDPATWRVRRELRGKAVCVETGSIGQSFSLPYFHRCSLPSSCLPPSSLS